MRRLLIVLALVPCLVAAGRAEAKKSKVPVDQVRAIVEIAARSWDRRSVVGDAVSLKASVAIRLPGREPLDGSWIFEHVGAGSFREELKLPGFHEVLVSNERGWWLDRKPERYLQLVADIQDALDPARHLRLGTNRSVVAVKTGKHAGRRVLIPRVVEKAGTPPAPFTLKLDPESGAPVRFDCRLSHTSYEYEGEHRLGDSHVPRQVRVLHSNEVVVTIDIEPAPVREPALVLSPPPGAIPALPEGLEDTEKLRRPVATLSPPLKYPGGAAFARAAGQVRGRLLIDATGEIEMHHVSWASDPTFADSALEAIKARRYRPGRRNGEPIAILSEVTFWFGGKIR